MTTKNHALWVLLAPGFDEGFVAQCVAQFAAVGTPVLRVGLQAKKLTSQEGRRWRPDFYLLDCDTLPQPPSGVILPGGELCATHLLIDPRVHQLVGQVLQRGQPVAGAPVVAEVWQRMGTPPPRLFRELPSLPSLKDFLVPTPQYWQMPI